MNSQAKPRPISAVLITVVAWLLSLVLGLMAIYAVYQLALTVFALVTRQDLRTISQFYTGVLTGQITAFCSGAVWLAAIIWTGEYALRHVGERRLYKIFAWMIGIEALLILIAWFLNLL
jgi:hypothetical protein